MKKIMFYALAALSALILSACAGLEPAEQDGVLEPLPQNRDEAAQFLATHAKEKWVLLLANDGAGNMLYATSRVQQGAEVSAVWLKMVFPQPIALSPQNDSLVAGTLIYTEVKCSNNVYRPLAYYAVGALGEILDSSVNEATSFSSLDAGPVGISVHRLACETQE